LKFIQICFLLILNFTPSIAFPKQHDNIQLVPIVTIAPKYPIKALENGIEGFVNIEFTINESGSVENPKVIESNPQGVFDKEAISAILKFKFKPTILNNRVIAQKASQLVEFKLPESDKPRLKYNVKYSTHKVKKYYEHILTIANTSNDHVLKEIKLPKSYKRPGLVLRRDDSDYVYYYYDTKKGKGSVYIFSLAKLNIIHKLSVAKRLEVKHKNKKHNFYGVSEDGNHLVLHVGKSENQKIISIKANTGKIFKKIALNNSKIIFQANSDYNYMFSKYTKSNYGNTLNIYNVNTLEKITSLSFSGKITDVSYSNKRFYFIEKYINTKDPEKNKFIIHIADLINSKVNSDFISSVDPKTMIVNEKDLYMIGRTLEKPKHLKVVKFANDKFKDISNPEIDMVIERITAKITNEDEILVLFGKKSVVRYDLLNAKNSTYVKTPFKIEGGIVSNDSKKAYVAANFGAQIGLVDFSKEKFIGSQHTGSKGKKVGNAIFNFLTMAVTAPTGYMLVPGIKFSKNALLLNKNQEFLFAINSKTDDVTVFNANDLSNKNIYPTGKKTFQILQAGHKDNLPVVVISTKQVTYFDAENGKLIYQLKYDNFVQITDDLNLIYHDDTNRKSISLYDISHLINQ